MNIFKFLLNFFSSKENRIDNLEAKNIIKPVKEKLKKGEETKLT